MDVLKKEFVKKRSFKHGQSIKGKQSKIYTIWAGMLTRCTNLKQKSYKYYGGRKIKVCYRWSNNKNGFQNFYKDVGNPPKGKSLDRINNNKGYSPNNWKWSSPTEQMRNTRRNHFISYNGKNLCFAEWEEITWIKQATIRRRIKAGWSIRDALTIPAKKYKKRKINDE